MTQTSPITVNTFTPSRKTVFVSDLDRGMKQSSGGIIMLDDDMTQRGIRERWGRVHCVGPDVEDIKPGDWVLVEHGRWTNGIDFEFPEGPIRLWKIDYPDAIVLVADEDPRTTSSFV